MHPKHPDNINYRHSSAPQTVRVLLVDDNLAQLTLVAELFKRLGVEACCCSRGMDALRELASQRYDMACLDLLMPGLSGTELARIIRNTPAPYQLIPLIAVSAQPEPMSQEEMLDTGWSEQISKPINQSKLISLLKRWTHFEQITTASPFNKVAANDPSSASPVDFELGLRLAAGNKKLARDLFYLLIASLEQDKALIQQAHQQQDSNQLLFQVHHLHGATRYCGVPELREKAHDLELVIRREQQDKIPDALDALNAAIDALQCWSRFNAWAA